MGVITTLDIAENKISLEEVVDMAIIHKQELYSYFDEGCTRYVFVNEDQSKVIKITKDRGNNHWNELEQEIFDSASETARNQMAKTTSSNGFIEQEFCMPIKYAGKKLTMSQIRFAQSCRNEVGWNKENKLVCFDLDEYKNY